MAPGTDNAGVGHAVCCGANNAARGPASMGRRWQHVWTLLYPTGTCLDRCAREHEVEGRPGSHATPHDSGAGINRTLAVRVASVRSARRRDAERAGCWREDRVVELEGCEGCGGSSSACDRVVTGMAAFPARARALLLPQPWPGAGGRLRSCRPADPERTVVKMPFPASRVKRWWTRPSKTSTLSVPHTLVLGRSARRRVAR